MTARNAKSGRSNGRVTPRKPRATPAAKSAAVKVKAEPSTPVPAGTLRLLKVLVQPEYALDTGDGLIPIAKADIMEVNGAAWAEWAPQQFTAEHLEATRATLVRLDGK